MATLELFHLIAEPESAKVRRFASERGLMERLRLRNVHFPEAEQALATLGGSRTPALFDGARLFEGAEQVLARLAELEGGSGAQGR